MNRYYRRTEPGRRETLSAALVAGSVAVIGAAVSFYLVRLVLAREPLEPLGPGDPSDPELSTGDRADDSEESGA
jgi:hypothetical protein